MPRKLKLALIGLGRRGRSSHLPIYPKLNDVFEFVAVCDKDGEVLREVAAEYGVNPTPASAISWRAKSWMSST